MGSTSLNGRSHRFSTTLYLGGFGLSRPALLIALMIAEAAAAGDAWQASQAKMGTLIGSSRRTICYALDELIARKIIRSVRRGRQLTNLYVIHPRIQDKILGRGNLKGG